MPEQGDVLLSAKDCLRENASDYEKEVVAALDNLEKVLQKAPDHPDIMDDNDFWCALYANLLDLTGSAKEFIKTAPPKTIKNKLILQPGVDKKLMLPPNCS